jgi:hypothetical protein
LKTTVLPCSWAVSLFAAVFSAPVFVISPRLVETGSVSGAGALPAHAVSAKVLADNKLKMCFFIFTQIGKTIPLR